jgi:hypothetical protein
MEALNCLLSSRCAQNDRRRHRGCQALLPHQHISSWLLSARFSQIRAISPSVADTRLNPHHG